MKKYKTLGLYAGRESTPKEAPAPGSCPSVGDTVTVRPVTFGSGLGEPGGRLRSGKVTYIHPLGRFQTVEFDVGMGRKIRECFYLGNGRARQEPPRNGGPGLPRFRVVPAD